MDIKKAKRAFHAHKGNAKQRGIRFNFTFESWFGWWLFGLGSDWQQLRGCRKGQYVMARIGDKGPYAWGNVKLIKVEDNHIEGNFTKQPAQGKQASRLMDDIVLRIFKAKGSYTKIADDFGITVFRVHCIKTGKYYSAVTGKK